jgi:hypothetical protein
LPQKKNYLAHMYITLFFLIFKNFPSLKFRTLNKSHKSGFLFSLWQIHEQYTNNTRTIHTVTFYFVLTIRHVSVMFNIHRWKTNPGRRFSIGLFLIIGPLQLQ